MDDHPELRILKLRPENMGFWIRACRKVAREVAKVHPDYPVLTDAQLLSFVKRLLPEARAHVMAELAASEAPVAETPSE